MTSFSLLLAVGCPEQQWESMLEEDELDRCLTELWWPFSTSAALASQPKSKGSNCLILFLLSKPRRLHTSVAPGLTVHWSLQGCTREKGTLTSFFGKSEQCSQALVQICSSHKLWDLHRLFRFCPHPSFLGLRAWSYASSKMLHVALGNAIC